VDARPLLAIAFARVGAVLTGVKKANEFPSGVPHGGDGYWRLNRAHMNCLENLPIFERSCWSRRSRASQPLLDTLAKTYLGARIGQSVTHVVVGQRDRGERAFHVLRGAGRLPDLDDAGDLESVGVLNRIAPCLRRYLLIKSSQQASSGPNDDAKAARLLTQPGPLQPQIRRSPKLFEPEPHGSKSSNTSREPSPAPKTPTISRAAAREPPLWLRRALRERPPTLRPQPARSPSPVASSSSRAPGRAPCRPPHRPPSPAAPAGSPRNPPRVEAAVAGVVEDRDAGEVDRALPARVVAAVLDVDADTARLRVRHVPLVAL
jgi:hypothetical protein